MVFRFTTVLWSLALLVGCNGNGQKLPPNASVKQTPEPQTIIVYKPDGSIQCEGQGITPETMQEQLIAVGVEVLCSKKGDSGFSVIAMCGAPTTAINVYAISAADWPKAEKLGFKRIEELSDYTGQSCENNPLEKR